MLTGMAATAYQFQTFQVQALPISLAFPSDIPQQARIPMDLHLRGKRVLITGASKGIGAAAA